MTSRDSFASVNGHALSSARLHVPSRGPWVCYCEFIEAPDVSGAVKIKIGETTLSGTVRGSQDGTYGLSRRCTIVGGGGGWGNLLPAKSYHNDAGVQAKLVAEDAAREATEKLGTFTPAADRIGNDYVRTSLVPASRTLEDAIGRDTPWWVDYEGVTHAGPRTEAELAKDSYEVLSYNPGSRKLVVSLDEIDKLKVGSILSEELDAPQTVAEFDIEVTTKLVATCSTGENDALLAMLFEALMQRSQDKRIFGKYRYRVIGMKSDGRVELQIVNKQSGLPDIAPVAMWPGWAGIHTELTPAAEVLVEFVEGDRAQPIITHFAGKTGVGFVPVSVEMASTGKTTITAGDTIDVTSAGTTTLESSADTEMRCEGSMTLHSDSSMAIDSGAALDVTVATSATFFANGGALDLGGATGATLDGPMVTIAQGTDFVALSLLVMSNLTALKSAISAGLTAVGIGMAANGITAAAAFNAAYLTPTPVAALKTKAG